MNYGYKFTASQFKGVLFGLGWVRLTLLAGDIALLFFLIQLFSFHLITFVFSLFLVVAIGIGCVLESNGRPMLVFLFHRITLPFFNKETTKPQPGLAAISREPDKPNIYFNRLPKRPWPLNQVTTTDYGLLFRGQNAVIMELSRFSNFVFEDVNNAHKEVDSWARTLSSVINLGYKQMQIYWIGYSPPDSSAVGQMYLEQAADLMDLAWNEASKRSVESKVYFIVRTRRVDNKALDELVRALHGYVKDDNPFVGGDDAITLLFKVMLTDTLNVAFEHTKTGTIISSTQGTTFMEHRWISRWSDQLLAPNWSLRLYGTAIDAIGAQRDASGTISIHLAAVPTSTALLRLRREKAAYLETTGMRARLGQVELAADVTALEDIERRSLELQQGYALANTLCTFSIATRDPESSIDAADKITRSIDTLGMKIEPYYYGSRIMLAANLPLAAPRLYASF
jgi:hypothetical protein